MGKQGYLAWIPPTPALTAFTMRMAGHGFSVSATLMNQDGGYALEQLRFAHTLADEKLRSLAMEVFRQFEGRLPRAMAASFVRGPAQLQ